MKPKSPHYKRRSPAPLTRRSNQPTPRPSRPDLRGAEFPVTFKASRRALREDLVLQTALEAYALVSLDRWLADRALEAVLRRHKHLYANERRAVAERVYALLRRERTIDFLLTRASPRFASLPQTRQDALRLACARTFMGEDLDEVIATSGVPTDDVPVLEQLPTAAAKLEALPFAERFPIAASLPDALAHRFLETFGDEAEAAAEAMNERAPLFARTNLLKGTREQLLKRLADEGVTARPAPFSPLGIILETRQNAFSLQAFKDGYFEIQDEGSQLLGMLIDAPPTKVIDACSGAGGKTLQVAAQMKNRGDLYAVDIDEKRMDELKRRSRRAGVHNVRTKIIPPAGEEAEAAIKELHGIADRVFVDAPCTGTGTFRRKPDARYRISEEDLAMHTERQRTLIERFSQLVKPGGRLIYGTCSILREENEDVIEDFLTKHPEFSIRPAGELLGEELGKKVTDGRFLKLAPHKHGTDGFFGAVLVKAKG